LLLLLLLSLQLRQLVSRLQLRLLLLPLLSLRSPQSFFLQTVTPSHNTFIQCLHYIHFCLASFLLNTHLPLYTSFIPIQQHVEDFSYRRLLEAQKMTSPTTPGRLRLSLGGADKRRYTEYATFFSATSPTHGHSVDNLDSDSILSSIAITSPLSHHLQTHRAVKTHTSHSHAHPTLAITSPSSHHPQIPRAVKEGSSHSHAHPHLAN
jgi:hypothetical protein